MSSFISRRFNAFDFVNSSELCNASSRMFVALSIEPLSISIMAAAAEVRISAESLSKRSSSLGSISSIFLLPDTSIASAET